VRDVIGSPLDVRERVRRAIQPANAKEIPASRAGTNSPAARDIRGAYGSVKANS
jgi:hypothetical protein